MMNLSLVTASGNPETPVGILPPVVCLRLLGTHHRENSQVSSCNTVEAYLGSMSDLLKIFAALPPLYEYVNKQHKG